MLKYGMGAEGTKGQCPPHVLRIVSLGCVDCSNTGGNPTAVVFILLAVALVVGIVAYFVYSRFFVEKVSTVHPEEQENEHTNTVEETNNPNHTVVSVDPAGTGPLTSQAGSGKGVGNGIQNNVSTNLDRSAEMLSLVEERLQELAMDGIISADCSEKITTLSQEKLGKFLPLFSF